MVETLHPWRVMGKSVRGASHIRNQLPNQDAIRWHSPEGSGVPVCLALSDGHGSSRSFRSDVGSRFAVDILVELFEEFLNRTQTLTDLEDIRKEAEQFLPTTLETRWKQRVEHHIANNPLTESTAESNWTSSEEEPPELSFLAYGATALGIILTEHYLIHFQLGDGDILNVQNDGEVHRPLPPDERLFANQTTSLCMPDCYKDVRIDVRDPAGENLDLVLVATDGYANSFTNDSEFLRVGSDLQEFVRTDGWSCVNDNLEGWLEQASSEGSGDDITLGIVCRFDNESTTTRSAESSTPSVHSTGIAG